MVKVIITSIVLLISACRITDNGSFYSCYELLPQNNEIGEFVRSGETVIMSDFQSIMAAIDGEAVKYIDRGFVEGSQQMYTNGTITIDVHIMDQGKNKNALLLVNDFYPSSPEEITIGTQKAVIEHGLVSGYVIYAAIANFFIEISTSEKSDYSLNMAKLFLMNINQKISQ